MAKVIDIVGAREHNLKNVSLSLPKNKLIVVTGVSGSGKSSLTIDTLYAEGQRRYIESLSSYARQFLGKVQKPKVDVINGICPAIALEQKTNTKNPRSTVATTSEIYDYIKLLWARAGKTFSPVSGQEVKSEGVNEIKEFVKQAELKDKIVITFQQIVESQKVFDILEQKGYNRILLDGEFLKIKDINFEEVRNSPLEIVVDRFNFKEEDSFWIRLSDSSENALFEGGGACKVHILNKDYRSFDNLYELDGIKFEKPNIHMFGFTNPSGACPTCQGYGTILGINPDLVIPDKSLSVYDEAVACWRGKKMSWWKNQLLEGSKKNDFPIFRSVNELTKEELDMLWNGCDDFLGIQAFFKDLEENSYKIQYRVLLSRYRGKTQCPDCKGTRLKKTANYVRVGGKNISDILQMNIRQAHEFFSKIELSREEADISERLLIEIKQRLEVLLNVGLHYLTLDRDARTLSGGESQRINLSKYIGSSLVGSLYVLDEPSIGLHPRDTKRLIAVLKNLQNLQNTVVVVEHDEDIMLAADHVVDMGPLAGELGGEVIFNGPSENLKNDEQSLTARYLTGKNKIALPQIRRKVINKIYFQGCNKNNLKNLDVNIPLNAFVAIAGVSGSGKTTLVRDIIYPELKNIYESKMLPPNHISGDVRSLQGIEFVDQNPLGRSSRSNPVTYVKAYDAIRKLMAEQKSAKIAGFKPAAFSFNVEGGRCEKCKGDGRIVIEMQFMPDVVMVCDECHGKRFKKEVIEVQYKGKNIDDILKLTIDEALEFFNDRKDIYKRLFPLQQVGLGYIRLGQPSNTLSGGEAQRLKLASFLLEAQDAHPTLFIFDEPTTGLHFHDIEKLIKSFNALIEKGHSVLVIEHNLDILKSADWLIELGPDGGFQGGQIVYEGDPSKLGEKTETGLYLQKKF